MNISITTPISAKVEMASLVCTRFSTQADDQTGKDLTHHLRGLALAGHQAKELCAEDDDCQVTENRIHKESFLYYKIPRTIYTFLSKTDNREQRDGRSPAALPFIL